MISILLVACSINVFGPGSGEWETSSPSEYGLNSQFLNEAADQLQREVPERSCLVVARRGKIIFEKYYNDNNETSVFDIDAIGKTAISALVGIAVTKGTLDLDIPLSRYNVDPVANWSRNSNHTNYYHNVTARHLLSQVSGIGKYAPGTRWTYDSFKYTQHLVALLKKIIPDDYLTIWAKQLLSIPLGIDLYPSGVWVSGGAMLTCRDIMKLGQLLLNKGYWRSITGKPFRLIGNKYIEQLFNAPYSDVTTHYGFLTWLNGRKNLNKSCCAPRWTIPTADEPSAKPTDVCKADINSDFLIDAGTNVSFAMGELGKHLLIDPHNDMVVLNFGTTWGSSIECDLTRQVGNYDELFTLRRSFDILKNSLIPNDDLVFNNKTSPLTETLNHSKQEDTNHYLGAPMYDLKLSSCLLRCDEEPQCMQATYIQSIVSECKLYSKCTGGEGRIFQNCDRNEIPKQIKPLPETKQSNIDDKIEPISGSCVCRCPPDQGTGKCFNIEDGTGLRNPCNALSSLANENCPSVGLIQECPSNSSSCELPRHTCQQTSSCLRSNSLTCMCHQDMWRSCEFRPNVRCTKTVFSPTSELPLEWFRLRNDSRQWSGANAYYLWDESDEIQNLYLTGMRTVGMKVLRVIIREHNNTPDLEPEVPGVFDDTILDLIDKLISKATSYEIKIIISAHDRWSLGCQQQNSYTKKYENSLISNPSSKPCTNAVVTRWYQSESVIQELTNRMKHILNYKSQCTGKHWSEMNETFIAFDLQHATQWGVPMSQSNSKWTCEILTAIKNLTTIPLTSGGDISSLDSLASCRAIDLLAVQIYKSERDTEVLRILNYVRRASIKFNKRFFVEDFTLTAERMLLLSTFVYVPWIGTGLEWTTSDVTMSNMSEYFSYQKWPEVWSLKSKKIVCKASDKTLSYSKTAIFGIVVSIVAGIALFVVSGINFRKQLLVRHDYFDDSEALTVMGDPELAE